MSVTPDTVVVGLSNPYDISYETFQRVQKDRHSPATDYAHGGYESIAASRVSVAFGLAVFGHESQFATDPNAIVVKFDTRNPGNCRSSRTGKGTVINTPRGEFVKYPDWTEGWRDLAFRLADPDYVYVKEGRRTIRQIVERFAPAEDSNDPTSYVQSVVRQMNQWIEPGAPPVPLADDTRFAFAEDVSEFGYPTGAHGRGGHAIELIVLHITVGTDSLSWLMGSHGSSAHYLTDLAGKPRAQMVRESDAAWTAGSQEYNQRGINIEVEMASVNDWTPAIMREVARTVAPIMARNGIPAVYLGRDAGAGKRGMIGHRDVPDGQGGFGGSTHHDDPGPAFDWPAFVGMVKAELAHGTVIPPAPPADDALFLPANPFGAFAYRRGFKTYVERIGQARYPADVTAGILSVFGFPKGEEYPAADGNVYQETERCLLQFNAHNSAPFDVVILPRDVEPPEAA